MAKIECSRSTLFALACLAILEQTSAQMIGVDICACLPTVVTFRLNFTFECDASNVAGPGIIEPTCLIETRQSDNVTDFIPTSVSLVQIFELNEELAVVGDSLFDEGYFDGSEITYTSIVERAPDNITSVETLPRGFQVWITGVNAAEQTIINQIAITYTGGTSPDCGRFSKTNYHLTFLFANLRVWNIPVARGRRADWMDSVRKYLILIRIVWNVPLIETHHVSCCVLQTDIGDPSEQFCPGAVAPSPPLIPPTVAPQLISEMPSNSPTSPNSSEMPSSSPSETPIMAPTDIIAPACPPIDNGGKSGIVNGGSGVAEEYQKATEDMDRYLRTGGCPEPIQTDTPTAIKKKVVTKDGDKKSPKEDVTKGSKGTMNMESPKKKEDKDKETGKMDASSKKQDSDKTPSSKNATGKGGKGTGDDRGEGKGNVKGEGKGNGKGEGKGNGNGKGEGKGKGYSSSNETSSMTLGKGGVAKESKSSTEDLDEESKRF